MNRQIKAVMAYRRISQAHVAKECQLSRVTLNRYLNGHSDLYSKKFLKIIGFLGLKVEVQTNFIGSLPEGNKP